MIPKPNHRSPTLVHAVHVITLRTIQSGQFLPTLRGSAMIDCISKPKSLRLQNSRS
jgi:hypothetical protein